MSVPVTLQITLAPSDHRHACVLLPHQVRTWRPQVAEILLTVDLDRSRGRFSEDWEEGARQIVPLAQSIPGARVVPVDYGPEMAARISNEFLGGAAVPRKDFRGGPYYSYFFGLATATHDFVLHVDSDMFFGGGSATWLDEAVAGMRADPQVLLAAPLSGPPHPEGRHLTLAGVAEPSESHAFRYDTMSTRLFLLSRARFQTAVGALQPRPPPALRRRLIAWLERNPSQDLPEHLFTTAMRRHGLVRREFLGRAPGMWSLHPPYRCGDFYAKLPELVRCVEAGEVPPEQRGVHDLNDSMVDWSEARAALRRNRLWRRLWRDARARKRPAIAAAP